jgi:Anaphase-promoting complex subunit 4 WD40 domain
VPESEFENNLTRFDVPVSALAYGPDGKMLAAACEDGMMKLVQVADQRVSCGYRAGRRTSTSSMCSWHCSVCWLIVRRAHQ